MAVGKEIDMPIDGFGDLFQNLPNEGNKTPRLSIG
jgi:hypothetical protein